MYRHLWKILKTVWEHDFAEDLWVQKQPYEGLETTGASGFTVKCCGLLVGGRNSEYLMIPLRLIHLTRTTQMTNVVSFMVMPKVNPRNSGFIRLSTGTFWKFIFN
jgi:hypothetical protein